MTVGLASPARVGARLAGMGAARPSRVVGAEELTAPFGKTREWLRVRTGIESVRRLATDEPLVDLAICAARRALDDAQVAADSVDAVVVATCSNAPLVTGPALSQQVADRLAPRAITFDLNAACAGFCYALSAAAALIATGSATTVLVVGAEQMSRRINPADLGTSILFGDGAGAAIVTADQHGAIAAPAWSSDGGNAGVLTIPTGETTMQMQGSAVFRWAVAEVHKVASEALTLAGVRADEIEIFVPHQANLRIVEAVAERIGVHRAVVADDIRNSGNTSAASIPMAVDALRSAGHRTRGKLALLIGYGAGLAIAAQVVVLP